MSRIESLKRKILRESAAAVHSPESGEVARATEPVFGKTEPGANAVAVARAHPRTAERSIMVILRNMSQFLTKGLHRRKGSTIRGTPKYIRGRQNQTMTRWALSPQSPPHQERRLWCVRRCAPELSPSASSAHAATSLCPCVPQPSRAPKARLWRSHAQSRPPILGSTPPLPSSRLAQTSFLPSPS